MEQNKLLLVLQLLIFYIIGCSLSSALSSTTTVSVAVDSTCNDVPSPTGPFEICSSSAILTCCVLGCDEWVGYWYITSDNGTNKFVGTGIYLNVTLTRSWQRFLCAITSDNLDCYDDGFVSLKSLAPVLHFINDTNLVVTEGSLVVICYEVLTDVYLLGEPPKVTFNGSKASRWHRTYYEDNDGKIGQVLQNVSSVHQFYICLMLYKFHHVYDDGAYAVEVHNECGSTTLSIDLKGICNDSVPVTFLRKFPRHKYAIAEEDITLSVKYRGIDINSFWKVNHTHYIDVTSHYTDNFCHTIESVMLSNVQYGGNYTVTAGRLGFGEPEVSSTVELRVFIKPMLVKAYQPQIDVATLLEWIFKASNFDHLVTFQCKKNDEIIHTSGRFQLSHYPSNTTDNMVYFVLKISNAEIDDIGNYSVQLIYNETFVKDGKSEIGYVYLTLPSPSSPRKTNWTLIGSLIGGLLLIFVLLIIKIVWGRLCKEQLQPSDCARQNDHDDAASDGVFNDGSNGSNDIDSMSLLDQNGNWHLNCKIL